jgi:hypothetical protein
MKNFGYFIHFMFYFNNLKEKSLGTDHADTGNQVWIKKLPK